MTRALPYDDKMLARTLLAFAVSFVLPQTGFAQERVWSFNAPDNEAFLIFGVPDTDDVGLSLWCVVGTGEMAMFLPEPRIALRAGEKVPMMVDVDGERHVLKGVASKDAASGLLTVEAKFHLSDKITAQLSSAQTLTVSVKGRNDTFPFSESTFPALISACKGE